ncbi:putative HTH-type transcriptional regulator SyrM [Agrobacterium tumefaciens str. Kerr 14]|uniref:Putative HTH-type transcriptional regulator SyrM n=1 Tax=Agrobacterium tumefaciens str. Kerr 14 TaxID=1183424 RepID=A0A1S7SBA3_AGRTU|nr:LysR family transcriptional regulator [Agrobacterium tumefaciens]CUX65818.1 putative HTH-type transcriptional regulator SyrM [Agrobacterium tumefaciens str. Kerr 14]
MSSTDGIPFIRDEDPSISPSSYDLNLLVVLHALLRSRNITHASDSLRVSPPATSRALGRLRELFRDELLVRRSRTFGLTPLAESLTSKVGAFLANVDKIFDTELPAPERFTVFLPDHLGLSLAGRLTAFLREASPATMFLPLFSASDVLSQLEQGQIDLAVGVVNDAPPGFFCRALPPIPPTCIGHRGHEAGQKTTGFSQLNRYLSIRIGTGFSLGFDEIEDGLDPLRPKGGEVLTVPDIHTAARLVEDTDALLVLPKPTAQQLAARFEVEEIALSGGDLPPPYRVSLIWHERWNRRSLHAGVRSVIASHVVEGAGLEQD